MAKQKESRMEVGGRGGFFYHGSVQAHERIGKYLYVRYFERMDSRARKTRTTADLTRIIENHIEERNYLIFQLADRDPMRINELYTWSLEALYQFLYANTIHKRRLDDARHNAEQARKSGKRIK